MNKQSDDPGGDLAGVEELLHAFAPAPVPSALRRRLVERMRQTRLRSLRARICLSAAAALLIAAAPLAYRWTTTARKTDGAPPTTAVSGNGLAEEAFDNVAETTEVVGVEDAGTTPMHGGAYRIVRLTFVHRTRETADGDPSADGLSERTSEGYMAFPLEIF